MPIAQRCSIRFSMSLRRPSDKLKDALIWRLQRIAYLCLEVGTAHRYNVGETIQLNDHALIIYPARFVQVPPVGGAHL